MPPKKLLLLGSLIAAASAFILGILSTSSCQIASVSFSLTFTPVEFSDDAFLMDTLSTNFVKIFIGLWRHQSFVVKNGVFYVENICVLYKSEFAVDGAWMAARAFGILASVIGGMHIMIILLWPSLGKKKSLSIFEKASPWIHLLCCMLQALVLVILQSELCQELLKEDVESLLEPATIEWSDECKLESGSKMTIASAVFYFAAFVLALAQKTGPCIRSQSLMTDLTSRSLSTTAGVNNAEIDEQNRNESHENAATAAPKGDESDEEATAAIVANPQKVVPKATYIEKAATVSQKQTPTSTLSPPKITPSKQQNESLISSDHVDNESRVSSLEITRNVSVSSSRVANAKGSRRKAKYR